MDIVLEYESAIDNNICREYFPKESDAHDAALDLVKEGYKGVRVYVEN